VKVLAGPKAPTTTSDTTAKTQTSYLFMIRRDDDATNASDMLVVFALDRGRQNAVAMLIPTSAVTEIPGHGSDLVGRGEAFGGMGLQSLVVDNLLGITLDKSAALTDDVLAKLVDQVGGLDIDVQGPLLAINGDVAPAFEDGMQHMDGQTVKRFLRFQGQDETELSRLARAQQVWDALIQAWGQMGRAALQKSFTAVGHDYGSGIESGLSPDVLADFFTGFASVQSDNRVFTTLPVTPVSGGGDQPVLRVDDTQVASLVQEYFSGSIPQTPYRNVRLEVLNGNGVPQIGEQVGYRLIPWGFRFVLDRNARSFDVDTTHIIVYDRSDQTMEAARKIQQLLGVGQVEVGIATQSLVDVTVVVGHDFNPAG
jgi:LCP family protein required for cell wall assembly